MRLRWMAMLFLIYGTALAQSRPTQPCPADALDATFQAMDGPDHNYSVALNLRNISGETCWMRTYPGGTGMSPDPAPDRTMVKICYYCEEGGREPSDARIKLAPGEYVHQVRSWRTSPKQSGDKCVSVSEMNWSNDSESDSYFWLYSHLLLKPICSPLMTTDYATGQLVSDTITSLKPGSHVPMIQWANVENTVYSREHIPLRVTVEDTDQLLIRDGGLCPRLFVRVRDATPGRSVFSRTTRVDEAQGVTCKVESPDTPNTRFSMAFDAGYALMQKSQESGGEYTVDVSVLAELKGRYLTLGSTNGLHLSMVGGKFIRRNWGPPVEGVAVSLTVDRDVYDFGSDVPLHIALENFSSPTPVFAMDPYFDPPGAGVELEDSDGHSIPSRGDVGWSGHGFCHSFLRGLVFPVELTLNQMGFHLDRPGLYKVVATWGPSRNVACGLETRAGDFTIRSTPVTFRVAGEPASSASPEPVPAPVENPRPCCFNSPRRNEVP